jgi:hypothetical protein
MVNTPNPRLRESLESLPVKIPDLYTGFCSKSAADAVLFSRFISIQMLHNKHVMFLLRSRFLLSLRYIVLLWMLLRVFAVRKNVGSPRLVRH